MIKSSLLKAGATLIGLGIMAIGMANAKTIDLNQERPPLKQPGAPGQATKTITPKESVALGQSQYTPADVRFMQMMSIHHNQAVEMVALIKGRTTHKGIITLGRRISSSQSSEIEMMHTWLKRRGHPISSGEGHSMAMMHDTAKKPDHSAHNTHKDHQEQTKAPKHSEQKAHAEHSMSEGDDDTPMMTGMLSRNQMRALAASQGKTFDELFLTGMILHHQGALLMVDNLLKQPHAGEDPEISEFLASIYADQSSEILRMKYFLSEL